MCPDASGPRCRIESSTRSTRSGTGSRASPTAPTIPHIAAQLYPGRPGRHVFLQGPRQVMSRTETTRCFGVQPMVEALELGDRLVKPELLSLTPLCGVAESTAFGRVVQQAGNRIRERDVVTRSNQQGFLAVLQDCGNAANTARDNCLPCRHPLEYREGHTFEARRADEDIHRRQESRHLFVRSLPEKNGRNPQLA